MADQSTLPQRRSIRLKYDYTQVGLYFVTICAFRKRCIFGAVKEESVVLSSLGRPVLDCWVQIPQHFPFVQVDACVVMPNHLHGILVLHKRARHGVPLQRLASFGKPVSGSLPTIISMFKAAVTRKAKQAGLGTKTPVWQRNYYEHIIRNGDDLTETRRYIWNNPAKWQFDKENPESCL